MNVLKWGTGGINIDACRIEHNEKVKETKRKERQSETWKEGSGFKNEEVNLASANPQGRFPANIIFECTCDELKEGIAKGSPGHWSKTKTTGFGEFGNGKSEYFGVGEKDKMKCVIHTDPNCPCYMLDEQSGVSKSSDAKRTRKTLGSFGMPNDTTPEYSDKGGASRFFYQAKASKRERNNFGEVFFELKKDTPKEIKKEIEKYLNEETFVK